ncbi:hypothetical protein NP233_g5939 [Leucocoprinus birnbaumii]|uniref:Reverse transcriptase domain-containing protein n=1 Tax=Leucocoprinus birnbaumii TaxID=56174 RepID=A0AAD5VUM1_9AGAR|nr:hypothetical protein NP233_g5939 [Leucocoprinus birnbaumii]
MAWVKQHNLLACEAIAYNGKPCHDMDSLLDALHGTYNAASRWQCDLAILDQLDPSLEWDWPPFSWKEMMDALLACSSRSAPGPNNIMWSHLKRTLLIEDVMEKFLAIADACMKVGYWPSHFKESVLVIIPELEKPTYSTPKSFRPIALLNMLGKVIEKMISTCLQFDCVKHEVFHPNQLGGIQQRLTKDAGILSKQGFPAHVCWFFASYLVGRGTRYLRNLFSSDLRSTDMGVGQGSALSPVLCNILSYVNDGTLIIQHKTLEDNLPPLREAYRIMFNLFNVFGLVMEHNKSELFHFIHQCDDANLPIVLNFEPFMAASSLKPKTFWRYLGFYFNQTLSFQEHFRYYSTKAISTVCMMEMLGNSLRGLTPKQKRILYQACVVPIVTYGFCLWYNDFARCKGHLQSLTKMQCHAAIWVIGTFRMSLTGQCEALASLIPIHLHLRKLASCATYRVTTLSRTHPVRSLMGRPDTPGAHMHRWHINNLGTKAFLATKSTVVDVAGKLPRLMEAFNTDSDEAHPGNQIMDVFSDRISFHPRPNGASANEQTTLLDITLLKAKGKEHSAIVACDSSVPQDSTEQALAAARVWIGDHMVKQTCQASSRAMASDAELHAIRASIGMATAIAGVDHIYVFMDHLPSAEQAVDLGIHSGQWRSLEVCTRLRSWLGADPVRCVSFISVNSKLKWSVHQNIHKYVSDQSFSVVCSWHLATSLAYLHMAKVAACRDEWNRLFTMSKYLRRGFLCLCDNNDKDIKPSYLGGGTCLKHLETPTLCARVCHCVLNHTPIGAFRAQFNLSNKVGCPCGSPLQTREHLLTSCTRVFEQDYEGAPTCFQQVIDFCKKDPWMFSFVPFLTE